MIESGVSFNIYTLLHCITGMRQYENKSLEVSMNEWMDRWMVNVDILFIKLCGLKPVNIINIILEITVVLHNKM